MTTVLDALVLTLGLDARDFAKGQEEVVSSFEKTKEGLRKGGKEVEKSGLDMAESLVKATRGVFDLFAAFTGGRGLKDFVKEVTSANTAVGNLSRSIGASPQFVSAWGMAAERMGGSAGSAMSTVQGLADKLNELRLQGKNLPLAFWQLNAKAPIDFSHGAEKMAIGLANAASIMARTDHAGANLLLRQLGFDSAQAEQMIRQGPRMAEYLKSLKGLAPREKDAAAAGSLTEAWAKLNQQFAFTATRITTDLAPALIWLTEKFGALIEAVGKWAQIHPFETDAIIAGLTLLTGVKIIQAIRNILALKNAILGLNAANSAGVTGGVLGFLAANPWIAGIIAGGYVMAPTAANGGEDEIARQRKYGQGPRGPGGEPLSGNEALRRRGPGGDEESQAGKLPEGGWWTPERQKHAFDVLRENGVSERGAIALISRWKNVESTGRGPDALNPYSGAYGIEQGLGSRKPRTNDFDDQLRAAARETRNSEGQGSGRIFDNAQDDREAARGASVHERAEGWNGYTDNFQSRTLAGMAEVRRNVLRGNNPLWTGSLKGVRSSLDAGARSSAALNNINNSTSATTTTSSNEVHVHGGVHVNAPQATDAHGVASEISGALADRIFAKHANFGPY